jgi:hypothetical protein
MSTRVQELPPATSLNDVLHYTIARWCTAKACNCCSTALSQLDDVSEYNVNASKCHILLQVDMTNLKLLKCVCTN